MHTIQVQSAMERLSVLSGRPVGAGVRNGRRTILGGVFGTVVEVLTTWQKRAIMRSQLAGLPENSLVDMGISRAEQHREASKPFWRA